MLHEATLDGVDVDQWEIMFDDQYACRITHTDEYTDHSIHVKRPVTDGSDWQVIADFGGPLRHTEHTEADTAVDRLTVLLYLYDYDPEYEVGEDVFVVSGGFEPIVGRGEVGELYPDGSIRSVTFRTDPFNASSTESRTIGVDGSEVIRCHDPSLVEINQFLGSTHLLISSDLENDQ